MNHPRVQTVIKKISPTKGKRKRMSDDTRERALRKDDVMCWKLYLKAQTRFASASSEALDEPESLLSFCSEISLCFVAASFASLRFSRAASALAFKSAIFFSFRRASCSAPAVFSDEESTVAAVTLSYSSSSSAAFELVILEALLYDL